MIIKMKAIEIDELTIQEAARGMRSGHFSSVEITQACLDNIFQKDKKILAFLSVFQDEALKQAEQVDKLIARKKELPVLAGIPLAIKDSIMIRGHRCSAGSKLLKEYRAPYDAAVIEKLRDQQAVFIGKTNLDEFSMGSSTENSAFQTTRNPHDLKRVPGGSSGGSAAAVASGEALGALGSDTGGSVRQPAAFCGLVGLKPTYGHVSRYGLIAFASSLDQIGPLTKTVEDARTVFRAIKGRDLRDSTSREENYRSDRSVHEIKIGVPSQCFEKGINQSMIDWMERSIEHLKGLGSKIVPISLPSLMYALSVYYVLAPAEVSANLARYDGLRYGWAEKAGSWREIYAQTRSGGFGFEVKRRIMLGTYTLSAGHYDAYYQRAQKAKKAIEAEFKNVLTQVDLILTPTTPSIAFPIGEKIDDPVEMYLSDLLTVSANLAGLPAVSIPVGRQERCPIGIQLIGPDHSEEFLLDIGRHLEWFSSDQKNG